MSEYTRKPGSLVLTAKTAKAVQQIAVMEEIYQIFKREHIGPQEALGIMREMELVIDIRWDDLRRRR